MKAILTAVALSVGIAAVALPASAAQHKRSPSHSVESTFDARAFWEEQARRSGG